MKFDQIILTGTKSITLFDLTNPRSTPYTAKTVDGLDPTDIDVTLAQASSGAGIYIGRREQLREMTFNVYLNPDYSIGQTPDLLREELYLMNPVNEDLSLDLRLMLEGVEVAMTPVYIKRTEAIAFSKDTIVQLVLASTSGTFKRRTAISVTGAEALELDEAFPVLNNAGSATSGFRAEFDILAPINEFGIATQVPINELWIKKIPSNPDLLIAGDRLMIDTNIGQRGVWRTRGGVTKSLMGSLTNDSVWLTLYPGENTLAIDTTPSAPSASFTWHLYEHTPKYRGV
uniref:Minor tail protein n=1 Tax=Gordonia phage Petito TaxID=3158876 RepID=A0AAU8GPM9_9CAUD